MRSWKVPPFASADLLFVWTTVSPSKCFAKSWKTCVFGVPLRVKTYREVFAVYVDVGITRGSRKNRRSPSVDRISTPSSIVSCSVCLSFVHSGTKAKIGILHN